MCAIALPGVARADIVSYWDFDTKDGVTISDQVQGSTHDGTLIAGADISTGGLGFGGGEALKLSAEGDYMDILDPTAYNFHEAYTWTARIKTTDGSGAVFSRNPNGTAWNQGSQALFVRGNTAQFDAGWVGNPNTGTAVQDDAWHQLVVTFDPIGDAFKIYVDGEVKYPGPFDTNRFDEATVNHNGGFANTSFTVGKADFTGGLASLDTLIGLIDDAAIFDTALTGDDLTKLFTEGAQAWVDDGTLTSDASGLWNVDTTWLTTGVATPTIKSIVNVLGTHTVTVAADGAANSLDVAAGGSVVVNGLQTLAVGKKLTTASSGAVTLNDTAAFSGGTFATSALAIATDTTVTVTATSALTVDAPFDLNNGAGGIALDASTANVAVIGAGYVGPRRGRDVHRKQLEQRRRHHAAGGQYAEDRQRHVGRPRHAR